MRIIARRFLGVFFGLWRFCAIIQITLYRSVTHPQRLRHGALAGHLAEVFRERLAHLHAPLVRRFQRLGRALGQNLLGVKHGGSVYVQHIGGRLG